MSLAAQRAYTEAFFAGQWAAGPYAAFPVEFQNLRLAPTPSGQTWMKVWIISGPSRQADLGTKFTERTVGILQIDAIVPEHTGTATSIQLAEWCGALFRARDTTLSDGSYLRFRTPTIKTMDPVNGVARCIMRIDWWRDDRVAQAK